MKPARPVEQSGSLVNSGTGTRLRIVTEPADRSLRGTVVFVHAFAEEMNKSRRMAARMARCWPVTAGVSCSATSAAAATAPASSPMRPGQPGSPTSTTSWRVAHPVCRCVYGPSAPARCSPPRHAASNPTSTCCCGNRSSPALRTCSSSCACTPAPASSARPKPTMVLLMQRLRGGRFVEVGGYALNPALAAGLERAPPSICPRSFAVAWLGSRSGCRRVDRADAGQRARGAAPERARHRRERARRPRRAVPGRRRRSKTATLCSRRRWNWHATACRPAM